MIRINSFSVLDLVAVIVSTHVMLVFFYRSVRLTKRMRLAAGVGYRFTGTERRGIGGDRLDGATGSLALQIGGGP